mgnify:CR=1 FL=1
MMARTHAMSGTAVGVAVFSTLSVPLPDVTVAGHGLPARLPLALGLGGMTTPYTAIMCLTLAATTLLPDWDTPSSRAATALPPLTQAVSRVLARAGHRTLTHAPAGIILAAALTTLASAPTVMLSGLLVRPGNGAVLMIVAAIGARALGASSPLLLWGAGIVGLVSGATLPATALWFMPASVALGMWVHRAGDALTSRGVENPLWPVIRHPRIRLPLLGDTGSSRESLLEFIMSLYAMAGITSMVVSAWS